MEGLDARQERELEHPIRRRMWKLFKQGEDRFLSAQDFLSDLADMKEEPSLSQVSYHLGQLQRLDLVPEPSREEL